MRDRCRRGTLGATLVVLLAGAAVLAPAAAVAKPKAHKPVKLALVPLPASAIGAVAKALPLQLDSGPVTNNAAENASGGVVTAKQLAKLGRRGGYQLDYGTPYTNSPGVHQVQTGVEHYTVDKGAGDALKAWRKYAAIEERLRYFGEPISVHGLSLPKLADGGWAYVSKASFTGLAPICSAFGMLRDGAYVLSFRVSAGSEPAAKRLALVVVKRLDARLGELVAGSLKASPVHLPVAPKAGPPPTGYPDPALAALGVSDFSQGTLVKAGYVKPSGDLSQYGVAMAPAGPFDDLTQEIIVMSTPDEAAYQETLLVSFLDQAASGGSSGGGTISPVDVSALGDDAHAYLIADDGSSTGTPPTYEGFVLLASGPVVDIVVGIAQAPIADTDVSAVAQAAATKLDAAVNAAG